MQQSKKLLAEDAQSIEAIYPSESDAAQADQTPAGPVRIRPITMYNDWVAILQDHDEVKGNIEVKKDVLARPEGIVVGVSAMGIPDGAGGRTKPQVSLGDRVAFQARSVL